jgi:hypothetical protein
VLGQQEHIKNKEVQIIDHIGNVLCGKNAAAQNNTYKEQIVDRKN